MALWIPTLVAALLAAPVAFAQTSQASWDGKVPGWVRINGRMMPEEAFLRKLPPKLQEQCRADLGQCWLLLNGKSGAVGMGSGGIPVKLTGTPAGARDSGTAAGVPAAVRHESAALQPQERVQGVSFGMDDSAGRVATSAQPEVAPQVAAPLPVVAAREPSGEPKIVLPPAPPVVPAVPVSLTQLGRVVSPEPAVLAPVPEVLSAEDVSDMVNEQVDAFVARMEEDLLVAMEYQKLLMGVVPVSPQQKKAMEALAEQAGRGQALLDAHYAGGRVSAQVLLAMAKDLRFAQGYASVGAAEEKLASRLFDAGSAEERVARALGYYKSNTLLSRYGPLSVALVTREAVCGVFAGGGVCEGGSKEDVQRVLRTNNPVGLSAGAVVRMGDKTQGFLGEQWDRKGNNTAVFASPEHATAAWYRVLVQQARAKGQLSLKDVVRYQAGGRADVAAQVNAISRWMAMAPDSRVDINNSSQMLALVKSFGRYVTGGDLPYTDTQLAYGLELGKSQILGRSAVRNVKVPVAWNGDGSYTGLPAFVNGGLLMAATVDADAAPSRVAESSSAPVVSSVQPPKPDTKVVAPSGTAANMLSPEDIAAFCARPDSEIYKKHLGIAEKFCRQFGAGA